MTQRDRYKDAGTAQRAAHDRACEANISRNAWRVLSSVFCLTSSYSKLGDRISQQQLAGTARLSVRSVRRGLAELVAAGIIIEEKRPGRLSRFRLADPGQHAGQSQVGVDPGQESALPRTACWPDTPDSMVADVREGTTEEEAYPCAPRNGDASTTEKDADEIDSLARVEPEISLADAADSASPPRTVENSDEGEDVVLVPPPADLAAPVAADSPEHDVLGYPMTPDMQDEIEQRKRAALFRALRDREPRPIPPPREDDDAA